MSANFKPNYNNKPEIDSQEISFKNYNPFIISLNKLLDDILVIGMEMYTNPIKIEEYYIHMRNIMSKYSVYFLKPEQLKENLASVERFFASSTYITAKNDYLRTQGKKLFDVKTEQNLRVARNKLLETFETMNQQFSMNGLIPTPEKKEQELWQLEEKSTLREMKKAVLDVVFGDMY